MPEMRPCKFAFGCDLRLRLSPQRLSANDRGSVKERGGCRKSCVASTVARSDRCGERTIPQLGLGHRRASASGARGIGARLGSDSVLLCSGGDGACGPLTSRSRYRGEGRSAQPIENHHRERGSIPKRADAFRSRRMPANGHYRAVATAGLCDRAPQPRDGGNLLARVIAPCAAVLLFLRSLNLLSGCGLGCCKNLPIVSLVEMEHCVFAGTVVVLERHVVLFRLREQ